MTKRIEGLEKERRREEEGKMMAGSSQGVIDSRYPGGRAELSP